MTETPLQTGIIKKYNADKGFGFIGRAGDRDVFFHISNLTDRTQTPEPGQWVRFEINRSQAHRIGVKPARDKQSENLLLDRHYGPN